MLSFVSFYNHKLANFFFHAYMLHEQSYKKLKPKFTTSYVIYFDNLVVTINGERGFEP
jgi:hypothetical protein